MGYKSLEIYHNYHKYFRKIMGNFDCSIDEVLALVLFKEFWHPNFDGFDSEKYIALSKHIIAFLNEIQSTQCEIQIAINATCVAEVWSKTKPVYHIDHDFAKELARTENLAINPTVLLHLSFNSFLLILITMKLR